MRRSIRTRWLTAAAAAAALAALVSSTAAPAATDGAGTPTASHPCLVMTGSGDPAFVRNFNPFVGSLPSQAFVSGTFYEPLIVIATGGQKPVPWLARSWAWSNGNKTLTLNLAHNAKWSDGKPLTSVDVVYSLTAGRQDKALDRIGLTGAGNNIGSIKAKGRYAVVINLKTADSQFISATLNRVFIVPKHVWSKVSDPATFTNASPVGSGPFNVVKRFTTQDFVLNKNPHYWQAGLPKVACLEYVQASSNDAALALIQNGPYSLVAFRKALSLAIDRNSVWKLGEYGYEPPADALGLSGLFPQWVTDPSVKTLAKQMAAYNPTAAKKMLTDNGFTYKGNTLLDPKGNAVKLDIHVISGWSDWVASNQIITKNFQAIGIDSDVRLEPSWGDWFPNAFSTKAPTLLWQVASRGSPYGYFYANLSQNAFIPSGTDASPTGNWEHFANAQATTLLNQWKVTLNEKQQHQIATKIEKIFLQQLPIVPVMIGARWSTYSTKYFHCFPTSKSFYADPIFTTYPDNVLMFTRICPGEKAGA